MSEKAFDYSSGIARAQGYVDDATAKGFPSPAAIATALREPGRTLLLYCPEQGGWQTGEWDQGEWTDTLTREKILQPTHWIGVPPIPV